MTTRQNLVSAVAAVAGLLLAGCPTQVQEQPLPRATILSFSASPTEANPGEEITLSWETENASRISLHLLGGGEIPLGDAAADQDSVKVTADETRTFILTAWAEGGGDTRATRVQVTDSREELFFGAIPPEIHAGEAVTLAWQATEGPVSITSGDGTPVHTSDARFGSVIVHPAASTEYTLHAGSLSATASVKVLPRIHSFQSDVPAALPGDPVTLSWSVGGATSVTLSSDEGVIATLTDPAEIADGARTVTMPGGLAERNGKVRFELTASLDEATVSRELIVWSGTDPQIINFDVPAWGLDGGDFQVGWQVQFAHQVSITLGGETVFVSSTAAQAQGHMVILPTPSQPTDVTLRAWNDRGGEITVTRQIAPVGVPVLIDLNANPPSAAQAGDPVTLSWNVPNARHVRIYVRDRYEVYEDTGGGLEVGSVDVYPNAPTEYVFEADNTIGHRVEATITVGANNPGQLTFSPGSAPYAGSMRLTGASVPGTLQAFDFAVRNAPGEAFIDISQDGTPTGHPVSTSYTMQVVDLGETFTFPIFDLVLSTSQIAVDNRGWFSLNPGDQHVSTTPPSSWESQLLPALAFAPYWELLQKDAQAEIFWRLDGEGPNRRLIVQWHNVRYGSTTTKRMTFQAQLYASGKVVYAYPQVYASTLAADTPSIGIVGKDAMTVIQPYAQQLDPDARPVPGDTFTFFSTVPPDYEVGAFPITYTVLVHRTGGGVIEMSGTPDVLMPGMFWISEANPHPDPATAPKGEWIEITNGTSAPVDLSGWALEFGGGAVHVIPASANLIIPPQGVVLLAQSADPLENGGINPDYVYGDTLQMPDASGSVVLSLNGDPYDSATWSSATGHGQGISARFDPVLLHHQFQSGVVQSTCAGVGTYGAQTGSPGTRVPGCFPYRYEPLATGAFEPLATNGGIHLNGTLTQDFIITLTTGDSTLPAPIKWGNKTYDTLTVSDNGFIALRDSTVEPAFTCTVTNCHSANKTAFNASAPTRLIAPFWDLLSASPAPGGMYLKRVDPDPLVSGDEYTIISWEHWRYSTTTTYDLNFQVKFFDTGDIEYHYGTMDGPSATIIRGSSATIWLESEDGSTALVQNITTVYGDGVDPNTAIRFRFVP